MTGPSDTVLTQCEICGKFTANLAVHGLGDCHPRYLVENPVIHTVEGSRTGGETASGASARGAGGSPDSSNPNQTENKGQT